MIQADQQINRFWDFNIGNFLTWIVVAVGFIWGRAQDWSGSQQRIKQLEQDRISPTRVQQLEEWKVSHEWETRACDQLLRQLELNVTKLTSLSEFAERRLQLLEEESSRWDGQERRNK